jgi:hypothetical protein
VTAKKKSPDLSALAEAGGSTRRRAMVTPAVHTEKRSAAQPSREGTAPITGHFPEDVRAQFKILAVEQRRTMHSLMAEAFNDLFAKYGKPEIAPQESGGSR